MHDSARLHSSQHNAAYQCNLKRNIMKWRPFSVSVRLSVCGVTTERSRKSKIVRMEAHNTDNP